MKGALFEERVRMSSVTGGYLTLKDEANTNTLEETNQTYGINWGRSCIESLQ